MISKLDLDIIDTHNFKTLAVLDTSVYNPDILVENVLFEITPPGYKNSASPFFVSKSLNIFNSNSVGITKSSCEDELIDLPDGLWKIKYSICPNDKLFIEKVFLKTDKIECKLSQVYLNLDMSDNSNELYKKKLKIIEEAELYINGAISAANNNNYKLSSDLYKKANNLLENYIDITENCSC